MFEMKYLEGKNTNEYYFYNKLTGEKFPLSVSKYEDDYRLVERKRMSEYATISKVVGHFETLEDACEFIQEVMILQAV